MTRPPAEGPEPRAPADEITLVRQLAHDARSPISALVVLSSSLRDQLADVVDELPRYHLELLHNAALSLDGLMDDLTDLGREGELVGPGTRSSFSLSDLLHDVRNLLLPMAELRDVPIEVRSGNPDRRTGHPAALRRALLGLAAHPLRMGGEHPLEITATAAETSEDEDMVRFTVRTEGPGPDPSVLETLSGLVRGERPRSRACFAHLGLELSFRLLDTMGARASWRGGETGGAELSFRLPLPAADPAS